MFKLFIAFLISNAISSQYVDTYDTIEDCNKAAEFAVMRQKENHSWTSVINTSCIPTNRHFRIN